MNYTTASWIKKDVCAKKIVPHTQSQDELEIVPNYSV